MIFFTLIGKQLNLNCIENSDNFNFALGHIIFIRKEHVKKWLIYSSKITNNKICNIQY